MRSGMSDTFHVIPKEDRVVHVHHALDGRQAQDPTWPRRRAEEVASAESLALGDLLGKR
jgi:hypothetical protein